MDLVMKSLQVTKEDMKYISNLCKYTCILLWMIQKGFITLECHRIGIVGKVIIENGQVKY
ncbi:MAG: hypothetical protein ACLVIU_00140 [Paraclostridium sp.]